VSEKIECKICSALVHSIQVHLSRDHKDSEWSLEKYKSEFPGEPLMSEAAIEAVKKQQAAKVAAGVIPAPVAAMAVAATATVTPLIPKGGVIKKALHEVFGLEKTKESTNGRGDPIPITVLEPHAFQEYVPEDDEGHVWDVEMLKNMLMAVELNIPLYVWGHTGTGKTMAMLQLMNRTNRPHIRVQHTVNTEESHILGQWTARGGETHFELGPLPLAMKHGWVYLADEYDFGVPSVLSVYQAVLEGKSLVIKEADAANRIIKPHPNFRFMANGNTNGNGDETGLYQGTSIQNHANYDRFGMVIEAKYMDAALEAQIIVNKAKIGKADADKLVNFAARVREAYAGNKLSATISPRTLIYAALIGMRRGSWRTGLALCFSNKLSRVDREVVDGLAQRIFPTV